MKRVVYTVATIFLGLSCLLAGGVVEASASEALVTDRPDITESSLVVGTGRWQIETSVQWFTLEVDAIDTSTWSTPTLIRVGAGSKLEFRLETDAYSSTDVEQSGMPSEGTSGFSPIEIGLKYHIRHGGPSAVSPSLGFLLHVKLPSGSTVFKIRDPETTAVLLVDFDLSDRVSFGANLGVDVFEDDPGDLRTAGIFTGALGFGITEAVGTFMEVASSGVGLSADDRVILFDAGLTYLFGPNAQIDTAAGFGVDGKTAPDFFVTVGFSFRGSYLK